MSINVFFLYFYSFSCTNVVYSALSLPGGYYQARSHTWGGQRLGWLGFRRNLDCYRRTRHTTKVSSLSQNRSHDIFSLGSETPFFDLSPVFPLTAQLIISLRIPWSPFRYRGTPASDFPLIHCCFTNEILAHTTLMCFDSFRSADANGPRHLVM